MSKKDKTLFITAIVVFVVSMFVGAMLVDDDVFTGSTMSMLLSIEGFALLVFFVYLFYKYSNSRKREKESKMSRYGATMCGYLKHISGLPIAKGLLVEVLYCSDKIVFKKDGQTITIAREKIKSIDLTLPSNSSRKALSGAATGKYVIGGKTGAALGALSSLAPKLTISYVSEGKNKYLTFDTQSSGTFASKMVKDFSKTAPTYHSSIEL